MNESKPERLALHWKILIGMLGGAILGFVLNSSLSNSTTELSSEQLPEGIRSASVVETRDRLVVSYETDDAVSVERVVSPAESSEGAFFTVQELKDADSQAAKILAFQKKSVASQVGTFAKIAGGIFLRLLQMVSVPLIIASLASGMMGLGAGNSFGRMFRRTITYYLSTSLIAITLGILFVNLIRPGINAELEFRGAAENVGDRSLTEVLLSQLDSLIPSNPFGAITEPNFLSIIAFTILFSIFAIQVGEPILSRLRQIADDALAVMLRLTMAIIKLAPVGVFFLMLHVVATQGWEVFVSLAWYMLAVASGLATHALIVLPLILYLLAKRNPFQFAKDMSPALLTAFSSASSNGTLPLTMNCVESRAGISNRTSSFVLPLGATINMDGTALYEAVAVLFIGQIVVGDMTWAQQITVAFTALLASVGAAGIPHAGLVMMTIILQAVNLPIEMQGIILAVDRILDMMRTSVNVWSDSCAAAVIERLDTER